MLQAKARWQVDEVNDKIADLFIEQLGLHPLLAQLITLRGVSNTEEAKRFLFADKEQFHDPYLLDGMTAAVKRIQHGIKHGERIRIYGDYDADGVSSTALMFYLLTQLQANFDYYIPHRAREGYGLNHHALEDAKQNGVSLIITVDNGISAVDEIAYATKLGMDVIVTDHHEPPEVLPQALAIINPRKQGCPYPFKHLAGVGIAFKLAHALLGQLPEELLEIAAIGTVADLMPLVDENRLIVKLGLERMQASAFAGIKALLDIAGLTNKDVTAMHIGFAIAPRINASGRLDSADGAVRLLTTKHEQEAEQLALQLDQLNKERQNIVEEISLQAHEQLDDGMLNGDAKVVVLAMEDWNVGVVGIVASKLQETLYRPIIILSIDKETGLAKGSARSIPGFDIYQALTSCADLLDHYGGHQAAAGMTLHMDQIEPFKQRLNEYAENHLSDDDLIPVLSADLVCNLSEMPLECIQQLELLAPFGMGNPAPRFIFNKLHVQEMRTMGKEQQHLKLNLMQMDNEESCIVEGLGFRRGSLMDMISPHAEVDVLGEMSINEWNGTRKPQIVIQDLQIGHTQVFDWRGCYQPQQKVQGMLDKLGGEARQRRGKQAILLSSIEDMNALPHSIVESDCSIWYVNELEKVLPLNDCANTMNFSDVHNLFLYSFPIRLSLMKSAIMQVVSLQRIYVICLQLSTQQSVITLPSRDSFKQVYAILAQQGARTFERKQLVHTLSMRTKMSIEITEFILDVFLELSFVERSAEMYRCAVEPEKKPLNRSLRYQNEAHRNEAEQILLYSTAQQLGQWIMKEARPQ